MKPWMITGKTNSCGCPLSIYGYGDEYYFKRCYVLVHVEDTSSIEVCHEFKEGVNNLLMLKVRRLNNAEKTSASSRK